MSLRYIFYIILLLIAILLLLIDFTINDKKKKERKKIPLKETLLNISKSKAFKLDKKSNYYKNLRKDLLGAKLDISPELFSVISVLIAIVSVIIVIIVSCINKFNLILNIDELNAAAEILGMPEIAQIDFSISINLILYTILFMIALPRLALKIIIKLKLLLEDNEILMLQTYTLMMIKANKPVKEILISLLNRSKMFKSILRKTVNGFSNEPNIALKIARESTANQGFEKIILSLEQALNNDRETSLTFLDNHRKLTKELSALNSIKKNNTKAIVSTLLLIIPLIAFAFIAGYPFLTYAMKMLNGSIL